MIVDTLRVYENGRFTDVPLPDWYETACQRSDREGIDWHVALGTALRCHCILLTEKNCRIEVRFWPSPVAGCFVLIETPQGIVEQIVILNPADWLPFLTTHITPLIAAATQSTIANLQQRMLNAVIAYARYGEGTHVDRNTGLSKLDLESDRERQLVEAARRARAQSGNEGVA